MLHVRTLKRSAALFAIATVLIAIAPTSISHAATRQGDVSETPKACYAMLEKVGVKIPGQPQELVADEVVCDEPGQVRAFAQCPGEFPWCNTIFRAFRDNNYNGGYVNYMLDANEGCDEDGWVFNDLSQWGGYNWDNVISSFRVYRGCNGVRLYDGKYTNDKCQSYEGDTTQVGAALNDKASSFRIQSKKRSC